MHQSRCTKQYMLNAKFETVVRKQVNLHGYIPIATKICDSNEGNFTPHGKSEFVLTRHSTKIPLSLEMQIMF